MKDSDSSELFAWIGDPFKELPAFGDAFLHAAIKDRMKYLLFALEVEIDSAVGNPGLAGNIGDLGTEVPVMRKDADSCAEDRLPLIGDVGASCIYRTRRTHGFNDCGMRNDDCRLPIADCRLPTCKTHKNVSRLFSFQSAIRNPLRNRLNEPSLSKISQQGQ